jgi:hypothetical protein
MEIILAKKILDLSESELIKILMSLMMEDRDAFNLLKEKVEDTI